MIRPLRTLRRLAILAAVLLAVLAVADRIAVRVAQDQIAQRLVETGGLRGGSVEVSIHGFPFLTQVARGRYADIEVQASGVALQDLQDVDLTARLLGVQLSLSDLRGGNRPDIPVESATGHLTIPYAELERRALEAGGAQGLSALSLSRAGDQVALGATATVLGVQVQGTALAQLTFADGVPQLVIDTVDLAGFVVSQAAVDALVVVVNSVLRLALDLPSLPYGLELTSAVATADGLRINASARDAIL